MGSLQLCTPVGSVLQITNKLIMNKFLAVVCLAAGAMAEADADPYYAAYGYGLAGYAGYPYAGAYGAYPYGLGYAAGYASVSPSAAVPALAGGYAGAGRYVANSAGVVHVAKREAEAEPKAEADAGLLYGAYGYGAGLGYAGLGYGYSGLGYAGYGGYGLGYGLGMDVP